jgi:hypothetical protein
MLLLRKHISLVINLLLLSLFYGKMPVLANIENKCFSYCTYLSQQDSNISYSFTETNKTPVIPDTPKEADYTDNNLTINENTRFKQVLLFTSIIVLLFIFAAILYMLADIYKYGALIIDRIDSLVLPTNKIINITEHVLSFVYKLRFLWLIMLISASLVFCNIAYNVIRKVKNSNIAYNVIRKVKNIVNRINFSKFDYAKYKSGKREFGYL